MWGHTRNICVGNVQVRIVPRLHRGLIELVFPVHVYPNSVDAEEAAETMRAALAVVRRIDAAFAGRPHEEWIAAADLVAESENAPARNAGAVLKIFAGLKTRRPGPRS